MNELKQLDVVDLIQDIKDIVAADQGNTPEEQFVFGSRCKAAVWELTHLVCGLNPSDHMPLEELVRTISVHRGDIHQTLNENHLSYFISVRGDSLIGEVVDRPSGQMIHCSIADGYDPSALANVFRNSEVLMLTTYH